MCCVPQFHIVLLDFEGAMELQSRGLLVQESS